MVAISLSTIVSEFVNQDFWLQMDIERGEEFLFAVNQDLSYLTKLSGIAYEIHSQAGLNLFNSHLTRLGLKPGKVHHDNDFKKETFTGFHKHPTLSIKLYRGYLFRVARRVLEKKNSIMKADEEFGPGIQYAWRI